MIGSEVGFKVREVGDPVEAVEGAAFARGSCKRPYDPNLLGRQNVRVARPASGKLNAPEALAMQIGATAAFREPIAAELKYTTPSSTTM